jgi:putative peptide zinc metalloprotease protein
MTEQNKKIVLPGHLLRRLEAFRIVKDGEPSYLLRDKVQGRTFDFEPWQFFILEVLPGCENFEKLQTAFLDRFDRVLLRADLDALLASLADRKLLDASATQHPLLVPFMQRTYDVEDGKAKAKSFATGSADSPAPAAAPAPAPAGQGAVPAAGAAPSRDAELPAGVQDALGMDWRTTENMIGLFDPRPMLRLLAPVLRPMRHVMYAVPLLLLAALMIVYQNFHLVTEDLAQVQLHRTLIEHLIFVFLTVHIVVTITAGAVADAYKVAVNKVGFMLMFGFMPRWVLKMTGAERLTRHQTMWLHGSTLIARVTMFSVGALIWYNFRDNAAGFSQFGLILMFACGVGLLLESGNPLVKANCYYLVSAFFNEPHLRGKAYAALLNKLRGGVYRAADNNLLALYALLSATYIVLVILVVGWILAKFLVGDLGLGGSAIILTLLFVGYMLWRNYVGLKKFGETFERQVQFDRWRSRTLAVEAVEGEVATQRNSYWKTALLICLLLVLFIPYAYEVGGVFLVYPAKKQVLSTDTPGLVEAVYFEGGESVKKGTVIARLAHEDYQSQVKVLAARIEEQLAVVNNLKTLPRPEEVKLAKEQLEVQRTREAFSREKVPRLEKMYKAGAVSFDEYDAARKDHLTDLQQVAQKEAELALVKAPVTADQIKAAEAKLASLRAEMASVDAKLERTVLRMPFDGNILTLHLQDKVNSFLDRGTPFVALEDTGIVTAEIDVAESDVQFVKIGAPVRARAVSYFDDKEFEGKVTLIDRNVTAKSTGNVVKVIATIDNRDGLLRTGMAGQAKIAGVSMPVWQAFTLAITRFVKIQVWSWLP